MNRRTCRELTVDDVETARHEVSDRISTAELPTIGSTSAATSAASRERRTLRQL